MSHNNPFSQFHVGAFMEQNNSPQEPVDENQLMKSQMMEAVGFTNTKLAQSKLRVMGLSVIGFVRAFAEKN